MSIVYSVDSYGNDARVSATADFVELLVLGGRSITLADLADFLSDSQVRRLGRTRLEVGPGIFEDDADVEDEILDGDDAQGAAREVARSVLNLLDQRSRLLKDKYPFLIEGGTSISKQPAADVAHDPYVALLALTTAHAYHIETGVKVTDAFEETVARAMKARIPRSVPFSTVRRSIGFKPALKHVDSELLLSTTTDGVVLSTAINDGGADTLAHLDWGDTRVGRWTFVGQVTCGRSDSWEVKANQANRGTWHQVLGDILKPNPFLAVPHHVEDLVLRRLVTDTQVIVLDRLRLTPYLMPLSVAEEVVAKRVLATDVEYL